jgi:hypothetical protein
MGKGGYNGGSTVFTLWSSWTGGKPDRQKALSAAEKQALYDRSESIRLKAVMKADRRSAKTPKLAAQIVKNAKRSPPMSAPKDHAAALRNLQLRLDRAAAVKLAADLKREAKKAVRLDALRAVASTKNQEWRDNLLAPRLAKRSNKA